MNIRSVAMSTHNICMYAAFLARSLKLTSVKQYVGIIGLLHKELGLAGTISLIIILLSLSSEILNEPEKGILRFKSCLLL